jgi:hypothetical protein
MHCTNLRVAISIIVNIKPELKSIIGKGDDSLTDNTCLLESLLSNTNY